MGRIYVYMYDSVYNSMVFCGHCVQSDGTFRGIILHSMPHPWKWIERGPSCARTHACTHARSHACTRKHARLPSAAGLASGCAHCARSCALNSQRLTEWLAVLMPRGPQERVDKERAAAAAEAAAAAAVMREKAVLSSSAPPAGQPSSSRWDSQVWYRQRGAL